MAGSMTDVTGYRSDGYRSDGGGLGQDQGLSKNLRGILTAKLPLLSAPGTVLENTLYYDINSSSVTVVEQQATFAKDRIAMNNSTFGSQPTAYIPSVLFAGTVFWCVKFRNGIWPAATSAAPTATKYMNIPHGWGFAAINQIVVYMGASTIAQIQIDGYTNFLINCACCETKSKRNLMLTGAGHYLNWRDPLSILNFPRTGRRVFASRSYGDFYLNEIPGELNEDGVDSDYLNCATVPIRLPWSSMAVLDKRLSIDCKLSTQPIQITLQTKQLGEFTELAQLPASLIGNQWDSSTLQLWQEELSDKSLSVRNELLAMPEFNVGYPFQYAQSIPFEVTATNDNGESSFLFTMNITSIINSDLTTFLFQVTWSGRTVPGSGQLCPMYGEELSEIELLLNGQRFFNFEADSYRYVTLAKQIDDPNVDMIMPSRNVAVGENETYPGFQLSSNAYEFNNSRLRSIVAEDNLQNTARFTNQTFQLKFRINRDKAYLATVGPNDAAVPESYAPGITKDSGYVLRMTYLYNAVFLVGGDGGTTKLITN